MHKPNPNVTHTHTELLHKRVCCLCVCGPAASFAMLFLTVHREGEKLAKCMRDKPIAPQIKHAEPLIPVQQIKLTFSSTPTSRKGKQTGMQNSCGNLTELDGDEERNALFAFSCE